VRDPVREGKDMGGVKGRRADQGPFVAWSSLGRVGTCQDMIWSLKTSYGSGPDPPSLPPSSFLSFL
jgi:hypothetical protein